MDNSLDHPPPSFSLRDLYDGTVAHRLKRLRRQGTRGQRPLSAFDQYWDFHLKLNPDPYASFLHERRQHPHQPLVGLHPDLGWPAFASKDTFLLVVGRAGSGKSSFYTAINSAFAPGPLVNFSSRPGDFNATAMMRGRLGTVWLDGCKGASAPGTQEPRWQLFAGWDKKSVADESAQRLVRYPNLSGAARHNETGESPFFSDEGAEGLAAFGMYCWLNYRAPSWAYEIAVSQNDKETAKVAAWLVGSANNERRMAGRFLQSFEKMYSGQKSGIYAAIARALRWWATDEGERSETAPNFNFDEVVAGEPEADTGMRHYGMLQGYLMPFPIPLKGRYDSYYVIDGLAEDTCMPKRLEFKARLRAAAKRHHEAEIAAGRPAPMPVYLCEDELVRFPDPDQFTNLADARDRGLVYVSGVQNCQQLRDMYKIEGFGDALNMLGTVVYAKGSANSRDNQEISDLTQRVMLRTEGIGVGPDGKWTLNASEQVTASMTPDEVARGHVHPQISMLWDKLATWGWIWHPPYFEAGPWGEISLASAEWAWSEGSELPLPPLALGGDWSHLTPIQDGPDRFYNLQCARQDQQDSAAEAFEVTEETDDDV